MDEERGEMAEEVVCGTGAAVEADEGDEFGRSDAEGKGEGVGV